MKTSLLLLIMFWCSLYGVAQTTVDAKGQLDSILVLAKAVPELGESAIISRDQWQIGKLATNPTEALLYLPGVHIRQLGPGQVSTLQYRGLQGARVAQTWQGLPVSNSQLGVSDVAEFNAALLEKIELGSPTAISNGAAVELSQSSSSPTSVSARYANGNGLTLSGGHKGLKVFYQNDEHRYAHSLYNTSITVENPDAQTEIFGASYTVDLNKKWSTSTYFLQADRFYTFDTDFNSTSTRLKTTTVRQLVSWTPNAKVSFDFGGLLDRLTYRSDALEDTEGETFQPFAQVEVQLCPDVTFTTDNRIVVAENTNYEEKNVLPQTRSLLTYEKELGEFQVEMTGGVLARAKSGSILFGAASISKRVSSSQSFQVTARRLGRLPTLDDLLWAQGGDQNLGAEKGWGISTSAERKIGIVKFVPVLFARRFSNYVLWLPSGAFWRPNNIPAVNNIGGGLDLSTVIDIETHHLTFLGSINYTRLRLEKDFETDRGVVLTNDSNLPFAPKLTSSLTLDYEFERWSFLAQGRYTSRQQTSYNALSEFREFAVLRTAVSYQTPLLATSISCDNLTNTNIPNDFGLFSLLRRFEITLNYTPKFKR